MGNTSEQKELLDAIQIMIDNAMSSQNTKIYIGIVRDILAKRRCEIAVNNRTHKVQYYGEMPTVGQQYRVFVPFNKMSQAFIITGGGEGGDTGTFDYAQLINKPSINSVTLTGNTTSTQLGLYGANNQPPYPVTKVNGQTGEVNLTSADVGALPDSTIIPTELSQLENDVGFITASESPVQSVNGETGIVVLDAQDVGALPDNTTYVSNVNGMSGSVTINKSTVGLSNVDNVRQYSTSNPPPYPVVSVNGEVGSVVLDIPSKTSDLTNDSGYITSSQSPVQSVNGETGDVSLTQDDIPNGTVYVRTQNNFTNAEKSQIATNKGDITTLQDDVITLENDVVVLTTNKLDKTGSSNSLTATFTESATLTNIESGSTLTVIFGRIRKAISSLISHIANVSNPHSVTKAQVGLSNVANERQYSSNNPPPYPVVSVNGETGVIEIDIPDKTSDLTNDSGFITSIQAPVQSVNTKTGVVSLTQDDVPNGTTYVRTENNFTDEDIVAISDLQSDVSTLETNKLDKNGVGNNVIATFTESATLTNITSGSTLTTMFSRIAKAISTLISHIANVANPHSVTKTQVGLGNVDNIKQYSSTNPPPYPVTSVSGKTGAVTVTKSDVGLANVANVLQYSASNPPPYPVVSVNGEIGAVELDIPEYISDLINDSGYITSAQSPVQSVNGETGVVTLSQDNIPSGSTYVQTENNFTDEDVEAITDLQSDVTSLETNKLDKNGSGNNVTTTFIEASSLTNITSGSTLSVTFGRIAKAISTLISHIANLSNPHSVTKSQVGLGNVDNIKQYSSSNPPPYPVLSVNGEVGEIAIHIPELTSDLANDSGFITSTQAPVQSVNGEVGVVVLSAEDVDALPDDTAYVESVNGASGIVTITKTTVGLGNVDNVRQYSSTNPPPYPVVSVNGEVGAVVLDIPTETSDLINDSGFITETDIPVNSVAGKTGVVTLVKGDVGLGSVDNVRQYSTTNPPPYPVTSVNGQTGGVTLSIPTKTSDLTNDSGFLPVTQTAPVSGQIVAYDGTKWINQSPESYSQQQANWNESNNTSVQYIQNKPDSLSDFTNDSGFITSAQAPVQSVAGKTGAVSLSKSDVGLANVANVLQYSASNPPPYPVTSVNGKVGVVEIDIPTETSDLTNDSGYITSAQAPVQSVAGRTGAITLTKSDVGLGNVDNTSDANKPISTATQTALNAKAPLASPALTGNPTAPTQASGNSSTRIATTAFVANAIASVGGGNVTYLSSATPTSPDSGDMWYKIL